MNQQFYPQSGKVRCKGISCNGCGGPAFSQGGHPHTPPMAASGFPADPSEEPGLKHQRNIQFLSLVCQRPQLDPCPCCREDRDDVAANTEWTPYRGRE